MAYTMDDSVHRYIRKLMALPFLPFHEIRPMFVRLGIQAQTQPLRDLVDYIKRQWIENTIFTPKEWSVYQQPIRTNDIEGWHNALNRKAGGQSGLPLYSLIELLHREARLTAVTIRLKRRQRKLYRDVQARLFDVWEQPPEDRHPAAENMFLSKQLSSCAINFTCNLVL